MGEGSQTHLLSIFGCDAEVGAVSAAVAEITSSQLYFQTAASRKSYLDRALPSKTSLTPYPSYAGSWGATRSFYSVAQHCVLVSEHCPPENALVGLMHDAAEAYCLDMPRPLKYMPGMEGYREIEDRVHRAVCTRFGLPCVIPPAVKSVDVALLMTERGKLFPPQRSP